LAIGLRIGSTQQPDAQADLAGLLKRARHALVYSEFGEATDVIWAANPADPTDRVALASASHAPGYGIFPSLSPDQRHIAYTAQTNGSASLWVVDVAAGTSSRLIDDVDLQSTPVWGHDGAFVIVRRASGGEDSTGSTELLRVDLRGNVETVTSQPGALYAIGFNASGDFYYAALTPAGTELRRAPNETVAMLSSGLARDWAFSPRGDKLAFLAQTSSGGFAGHVLDLATSVVDAVGGIGGHLRPIWEPAGSLTIGVLPHGSAGGEPVSIGPDGAVAGAAVAGARSGFDVPLSWSPDSAYLVVRHFEGSSAADTGPSWLWTVDLSGNRERISEFSDVNVAGWLSRLP
jgi:hypothetical protein